MVCLYKNRCNYFAAMVLLLMFSLSLSYAQETAVESGDPVKGKELFNANCAACHDLDKKKVGPALGGIVERLQSEQNIGTDWLHKWIKDSQALVKSGDEYADKVFQENGQVPMPPFASLSDTDIDNILAYTSNPPKEEEKKEAVSETKTEKSEDSGVATGSIIIGFVAIASVLIWMLFRVNTLYKLTIEEGVDIGIEEEKLSFKQLLDRNQKWVTIGLVVFSLLVLYGLWNAMLGVDVNKGYRPEQPIYFSHKIHAGIQGIDCQMCHTSAKYGKVSGIPTTNICMNCHYSIQEYKGDYVEEGKSKEFYTKEIQKIYESSGFDKDKMAYVGDKKPIEWVRIHNMPDFVYFNHAQHVVAGGDAIKKAKNVEQVCYACHGRVDEMNVIEMANDFTMGWCIECHRTTEVDMENGYNKEYYAKLHEKLVKQYGKDTKITVDAIGGLECGKCHY